MTGQQHGSARTVVCCTLPMTTIEVTQAIGDGVTLALHTCASCGRHVWERDGVELDRTEVLDVVQSRIAEGPAARVPGPRPARAARTPAASRAGPSTSDVTATPPPRLAEFIVHGTPRP